MSSDSHSKTSSNSIPSLDELSSVEYWEKLLPGFSVNQYPFRLQGSDYRFSDNQAASLPRQIKKEGYFHSETIIPQQHLDVLAQAAESIDRAGILPVFIALHDKFWQVLHSLRNTFAPILGESYRLAPDFWVWHIAPNETGRGWGVHRDSMLSPRFGEGSHVREDGSPRLCTIWIPLADATTHNSCIYVLPFPHDPAIQSFFRKEDPAEVKRYEQAINWTNVRALPADAGSILGWTSYILHWGSQSTDWATHARSSMGIYFESADSQEMFKDAFDSNGRKYIDLHDENFCLSLEDRLTIVANILSTYVDNGQMDHEPNFSSLMSDFYQRWRHQK